MKHWKLKKNEIICLLVISTMSSYAQQVTQKGIVKDGDGTSIIGASVKVVGKTNSTVTDTNGNFSLPVGHNDTIMVSYLGFLNKLVKVNPSTLITITLQNDTKNLEEVVVVGFGTQKKVNLTGAVGVVTSEAIESRPVQNALQALEGVSPGLNISYSNGGLLNSSPDINIRGIATIGQGSTGNALVLIDGMEGDLNTINPQDIENISVLKDAAASSIYGSRAPFGVILVTTKTAKRDQTKINFNTNVRFSTPMNLPKMMDSYSFATFFNLASNNAGQGSIFDEERMQRIQDYQNGKITSTTVQRPNSLLWGDGYDYGNDNIDYYQVLYKKFVPSQEYNISFSKGTEKTNVYLSTNYLNQLGFISYGEDKYQRIATTAKIGSILTNWLSLNANFKFSNAKYTQPSHLRDQLFEDMGRQIWPTKPLYDPNGNLYDDHIIGLKDGGKVNDDVKWLYQQAQFVITPIDNWKIYLEVNSRINFEHYKRFVNTYYNMDVNGNIGSAWEQNTYLLESYNFNNYLSTNVYSNYEFAFKKYHKFKLMIGFQSESNNYKDLGVTTVGLMKTDFPSINTTSGISYNGTVIPPTVYGQYTDWSTVGFFGRINYDFNSKYLVEINLRYDGSSRFRPSNRWGFFPSVSAGWNIAEEEFFKPLRNYVDYLKLRGSYGTLGNQNTMSNYPTYSTMNIVMSGGNFVMNQQKPNVAYAAPMVSSSLTWEKIKTYNIGFDYGLFNSRLTGSFDTYRRFTKDMVGPAIELPATLGTTVPLANNTDLVTYGFEFEIGWRDHINNGFGYSAKLTLSDSQTKILKYSNPTNSLTTYREGQMLGEIWGYTTVGIAKTQDEMDTYLATLPNGGQSAMGNNWSAGDIMYKDINGDGKIDWGENTSRNPGDVSKIGNSTPRYSFGMDLSVNFKGFDLRAFFQGILKRDIFQNSYYFWGIDGGRGKWFSTGFVEHEDYWRTDNLDAYYPRPLFGTVKNQQVQTRYLQDGKYVRLKNLQLGYSLPKNILKKINIIDARLYVSGENVFTFTKMSKIFDPETVYGGYGGSVYPLSKVYSFGLNITF